MAREPEPATNEGDTNELRARFRRHAPGRLQRVFGIHSGRLVSCDRAPGPGAGSGGRWLYRAAAGGWFLLEEDSWRELAPDQAVELRAALPMQLPEPRVETPGGTGARPEGEAADLDYRLIG